MPTPAPLRLLVCVVSVIAIHAACSADPALFDDFEDNDVSDWNLGPVPWTASDIDQNTLYGRPATSDGRVWGIGSGYSEPVHTWMVRPTSFSATENLTIEVVGRSGTPLPNEATIVLLSERWPLTGEVYTGAGQYNGETVGAVGEGYSLVIDGQGNQRVYLHKQWFDAGGQKHQDYLFMWSHNVTTDQMYRAVRNQAGEWTLWYGNPDGTNMQQAPGTSVTEDALTMMADFSHVGIALIRDQTTLDSIRIEAQGVVPEPLSMAFMGSAFVGVVAWRARRRRKERGRRQ